MQANPVLWIIKTSKGKADNKAILQASVYLGQMCWLASNLRQFNQSLLTISTCIFKGTLSNRYERVNLPQA